MKRMFKGLILTVAFMLCMGTVVFADGGSAEIDVPVGSEISPAGLRGDNEAWVGGGYWRYGTNVVYVYSYYSHETKWHSSTAKGVFGRKSYSGDTEPGKRAVARYAINPLGGNRAWWNAW